MSLLASAVCATLSLLAPAFAQQREAPSMAPGIDAGLETITVTARRRAESLIDAPISVTALSAAAIEARGSNG